MKVWKVKFNSDWYYESSPGCVAEMLSEMTPGNDIYEISCHEISREEYDNLPEF